MRRDRLTPDEEAIEAGRDLMVVVNATRHPDDFLQHHMYCTPTEGHAWHSSHRHVPARYLGNLVKREVRSVATVAACVHIQLPGPSVVLWKYSETDDAELIARAEHVRSETRRHPRPCIVLLQDDLTETRFIENMPEPFRASRQFFDLRMLAPVDVQDLALKLRKESWATLLKRTV